MKKNFYTFITLILISSILSSANAQNPSQLPDSIYKKETFGTGNTKTALPPGRTTYSFNNTAYLVDGEYFLNKSTNGRPEWHNAPDHTGDLNGKSMVINAGFAPAEFYRDTVYGLISGTSCSVYLYIMNTNTLGTCGTAALLPKLQFIVEYYNQSSAGYTELTSFTTASIPQTASPTWVKAGGSFYIPAGVNSVRYRILNNSSGGCGNDLAIDDITFAKITAYAILPITGLQLSASASGNKTQLHWETLTEMNSSKFIVEKSYNGSNWEPIDSVIAAGISNSQRFYNSTDNKPGTINLYRIREVDKDGRKTYSNTVRIILSKAATAVNVYPNPAINQVQVDMNSNSNQVAGISINDAQGRTFTKKQWLLKTGKNSIVLADLQKMAAGIYFINITAADGTRLYNSSITKN